MPLPAPLDRLRLPVMGAPMFLVSSPQLVIAQCRAGIVGSFPALNARTPEILDTWLTQITEALHPDHPDNRARPPAPFAVNQIVAPVNTRLDDDMAACVRHRVPIVITSVGSPGHIVAAAHAYGGVVLHDVVSVRHAHKAAAAGVDGIVAVCAGAGGHGGSLNPFGFVKEIRRVFGGVIALAGALSSGADILAAQLAGADLAYMGTRFLGTQECEADALYKQMLQDSSADDIVNTALFSGMPGNYLARSIARTGLDPSRLPTPERPGVGTGGHGKFKLWKDIWAAGHGVGAITDLPTVAALVDRWDAEYREAAEQAHRLVAALPAAR